MSPPECVVDQLTKLHKLRSDGVIDDGEFEKLKAAIVESAPKPSVTSKPEPRETSTAYKIASAFARFETFILIILVVGSLGLFLYPLAREGVSGPCAAVEARWYPWHLGNDGAAADAIMRGYYRDYPPFFTCTLVYYGQLKAPGL